MTSYTLKYALLAASVACMPVLATAQAAAPATASAATASGYVPPHVQHAPYGEVRIVVPLTTNDPNIQKMKLRNVANALGAAEQWKGKFVVTFVMYAKGISFLENPDDATRKQIDELKAKGVRFEVCNNTMREQGVNFHDLYHVSDADIVPSGFGEVAWLQAREHYVIVPVD